MGKPRGNPGICYLEKRESIDPERPIKSLRKESVSSGWRGSPHSRRDHVVKKGGVSPHGIGALPRKGGEGTRSPENSLVGRGELKTSYLPMKKGKMEGSGSGGRARLSLWLKGLQLILPTGREMKGDPSYAPGPDPMSKSRRS